MSKHVVVEHTVDLRTYIVELLHIEGLVSCAEHGEEVHALLQKINPDLIITDLLIRVLKVVNKARKK